MKEVVAQALKWFEEGAITRGHVLIQVGMELADVGTLDDIADLPQWLREDLLAWADNFEKSQEWLIVSNAGEKDATKAGKKLLSLIRRHSQ